MRMGKGNASSDIWRQKKKTADFRKTECLPNVLQEQEEWSYEKKKAVAANRMKLSFLDRISLPNDFKIALVLFFFL